MTKSLNRNFILSVLYQIFVLIVPLLTTPYISRVLGVENIGLYSYTYSIASFFVLFAMLGINNQGIRSIAKCGDDRDNRSRVFWNLYILQLVTSLMACSAFLLFVLLSPTNYKNLLLLQGINLISAAIDISWLYFGLEEFKLTISRNIIVKILSLFAVFIFVKNTNDLWKYIALIGFSTLLSQLFLWSKLKLFISKAKINRNNIIKNVKPCLVLFIPVLAYSIYRLMDKVMIGALSNHIELGNYESAEKIINIPISIIMALGTALTPHMSKKQLKPTDVSLKVPFELGLFIAAPMSIGLIAIANDFSFLFFGDEYANTGSIITLLSPIILFSTIASIIRTGFLIPLCRDKIYVKSTVLGAIVNLAINICLIPLYGAFGACLGTILAEFSVMAYQVFKTRHLINYKRDLRGTIPFITSSLLMLVLILPLRIVTQNLAFRLCAQITLGASLYICLNKNYLVKDFLGLHKSKK